MATTKTKKSKKEQPQLKATKKEAPPANIAKSGQREATWLPLKTIVMPAKGLIARETLGDISDLMANIKKHGQLQSAVVRPGKKAGEYELLSGHRRFQALKKLSEPSILVQIRPDLSDDTEAFAAIVSENAEGGRFNLTATEQARAFAKLYKELGNDDGAIKKIAGRCATTVENVRRTMKLLEAPKAIIERLEADDISKDAVMAYQQISDPDTAKKIAKSISEGKISTRPEIKQAAIEFDREATEAGEEIEKPKDKRKVATAAKLWRGAREMTDKLEDLLYLYGVASGKWEDEEYKEFYKDEDIATNLEIQISVFLWLQSALKDIEQSSKTFRKILDAEVNRVYEYHKKSGELSSEEDEAEEAAPKKKDKKEKKAKKGKKKAKAEQDTDGDEGPSHDDEEDGDRPLEDAAEDEEALAAAGAEEE